MKFPIDISIGIGSASGRTTLFSQPSGDEWVTCADPDDLTLWRAFYFIPSASGNMSRITLTFRRNNGGTESGNLKLSLRADNAGDPDSTEIASANFDISTVTNTGGVGGNGLTATSVINFPSTAITASTKYWIVFDPSSLTGSGFVDVRQDAGASANAGYAFSSDSGSTWSPTNLNDVTTLITT